MRAAKSRVWVKGRIVSGQLGTAATQGLKRDTILIARNLGPAELLEYDRRRLKGVILEEGSLTAHVVIVARAMGVPVIGRVRGLKVRLTATARVEGDIIHKTIAIESGAHFEGSVQRQEDPLASGRVTAATLPPMRAAAAADPAADTAAGA